MLSAGDCLVKRVRVLVANHPRLMRELVMATIADQPDIEVVGEVQNESDLTDIVEQVQPDVLIIAFHVLPHLLGKMRAFPIGDYLLDIGTMPNYQKAQTTWPGSQGSFSPDQRPGAAALPLPPSPGRDIRSVQSGGKS
jgi:DNA-binding NarL/FixJ family response regulator